MNRLFILLIFVSSCDWARHQSRDELIYQPIPNVAVSVDDTRLNRTKDEYLLLDTLKFSGHVLSHYPDKVLKSKQGYVNGRLEGMSISYYPDGSIFSKRPYANGEKHGRHLGYYPGGEPKFNYYFENGLGQGTHLAWYNSGQPYKEMNYKDGHELGTQKVWRRDGKLRSNYVIRENGRRYGMLGLKRCSKIDSESGDIDPYVGVNERNEAN